MNSALKSSEWNACFDRLTEKRHIYANRLHVRYDFIITKELMKRWARVEESFIRRQQFTNVVPDCFCAFQTHQLENLSLTMRVCKQFCFNFSHSHGSVLA